MPRRTPVQVSWKRSSSSSSTSSTSTRSHGSGQSHLSSHTQYTNLTSESDTKPIVKHYDTYEVCEIFDEPEQGRYDAGKADPRASVETYASTSVSETESPPPPSYCPAMRHTCYEPDALATTPADFGELFPSTRRLLIQHDDTTPDGNWNLRVDTELAGSRGRKTKLTLFHLRMYDIDERQYSLRRYQRDSGREICNSKRKYLKPAGRPSPAPRRRSLTAALNRMTLKTMTGRGRARTIPETELEEDSDGEFSMIATQADVKATIPTNAVRIEFSNYAQVELQRGTKGEGRASEFEYWGEKYYWRRDLYQEGTEVVFSLGLMRMSTGTCIAHITPDKLSSRQRRQEAAQGGWVPPCSMRVTEMDTSNDLGDVIVATGLMTLVDECIKRHWKEPHRS